MADSSASVTIVHQGLREKITIDKSRPLMSALTAYCQKYGLDASRYRLVSGKNAIDLGVPFQFSSVLNNALLELEEVRGGAGAGAAGPEVKLTLMLTPGGGRVEGSFPCNTTTVGGVLVDMASRGLLKDAVPGYNTAFSSNEEIASFIAGADNSFEGCTVVYVRSALKGKELATTTLASFGLIKGAAGLRVTLPAAPSVNSPTASSASAAAIAAVPAVASSEARATTTVAVTEGVAFDAAQPAAAPAINAVQQPATVFESPPSTVATTATGTATSVATVEASSQAPAAFPSPAPVASASSSSSSSGASVAVSDSASNGSAQGHPQEPAAKRTKLGNGEEYAAPSSLSSSSSGAAPASSSSVPTSSSSSSSTSTSRLRNAVARVNSAVERLRASLFDADSKQALKLALTVLDNLLLRPDEPKVRTLKFSNQRFFETLGQHPAAVEIIRAAGFEERDETVMASAGVGAFGSFGGGFGAAANSVAAANSSNRILILSPESENDDLTTIVRETLAKAISSNYPGEVVPPTPSVNYAAKEAAQEAKKQVEATFDPYRSVVIKPTGEIAPPAAAGNSGAVAAGGAGSASSSSSSSAMAVDDSTADSMTHTDRLVLNLRQKAVEIQKANRPPADRATSVLLYTLYSQLQGHLRATAAAAAAASGQDASSSSSAAMAMEEDEPDAESSALMMEFARKKMAEQAKLAKNDGLPLTTAAQRELDALQKAKIFTQTVVKVQLPMLATASSPSSNGGAAGGGGAISAPGPFDQKVILKGVFSPLDTVSDLYAWVQGLLHPDLATAGLPFYLYSTPPPQQFGSSSGADDNKRTLQEAKLVPAKLLYLSFGQGLGKGRLNPGDTFNGFSVPLTIESALHPTEALEKGKAVLRYAHDHPHLAMTQDIDALVSSFSAASSSSQATALGVSRPIDLASAPLPSAGTARGAGASSFAASSSASSDLDDAALERMAQALLSGETTSLSGLSAKAGSGPSGAAGGSGRSAAAGGSGGGAGGAGAGGAKKPSWLKM